MSYPYDLESYRNFMKVFKKYLEDDQKRVESFKETTKDKIDEMYKEGSDNGDKT